MNRFISRRQPVGWLLGMGFLALWGALPGIPQADDQKQPRLAELIASPERDWPMMRHDSRNTGYTPQELTPPLRLAWRVPSYRPTYPFLLASGRAVCVAKKPTTTRERPEMSLFSRSTGGLIWRIQALPVYLQGDLLVVVTDGEDTDGSLLQCYNWERRTLQWSHPLGGRVEWFWGAIAAEGRLYCAYQLRHAVLKVLQLQDGTSLTERVYEEGWAEGPPARDGPYVYWGVGHWLHVLDAETLEPQWAYYDGGNAYPIPLGPFLLTQGWNYYAQALHLEERQRIWRIGVVRGRAHCLAPGSGGTPLVIEYKPSLLLALAVPTGEVIWRYPLMVEGLTVGSGRFVYTPGWHEHRPHQKQLKGGFYCLEAATGKRRWKYERPNLRGVSVVVSEDSLFALDGDGFLYRFVPAKGPT